MRNMCVNGAGIDSFSLVLVSLWETLPFYSILLK